MASFKRRRATNIDVAYIDKLKRRASEKQKPTTLASMIFVGTEPSLGHVYERGGKAQSISMTEAMWLSIRKRSESIDKSVRQTTQLLLSGKEKPLTKEEISFGLERAREREARRAQGNPEEITPPLPQKPAATSQEVSEPEPVETPNIEREDEPVSEQATEPDPSNIVKEERAEESEAEKMRKMKLSKGHPVDLESDSDRADKKLVPGGDSYGGVFTI